MTSKIKRDEFDKYIINVVSIHRKVMLTLFDLELTKNDSLRNKVEIIKNLPDVDKTYFLFEGIIDFKSMILLLEKYNSKKDIKLLININNENEYKILKDLLKKSPMMRNDLWHNCIEYNNPKKYYEIISSIKIAYELFEKNEKLNKKELFTNCIKYLNICLEFLKDCIENKIIFDK